MAPGKRKLFSCLNVLNACILMVVVVVVLVVEREKKEKTQNYY